MLVGRRRKMQQPGSLLHLQGKWMQQHQFQRQSGSSCPIIGGRVAINHAICRIALGIHHQQTLNSKKEKHFGPFE